MSTTTEPDTKALDDNAADVADETSTDDAASLEYATDTDMLETPNFSITRKAGYVEEQVDVWVQEAIRSSADFLNRYNEAVYRVKTLEAEAGQVEERITRAVADAVEDAGRAAAVDNDDAAEAPSHEDAVAAARAQLEAEFEARYTSLAQQFDEEVDRRAAAKAEELAAASAETEEADAPLTRAQRVLAHAADEAAALLARTAEYADRASAEADAEADEIRKSASTEAEGIRTQAVADVAEATETRDRLVAEQEAIITRLRGFYDSQRATIDEVAQGISGSREITNGDSSK